MLLVSGVDLVAPLACLLIQILPTGEGAPGEEVSLDKAEWPLHPGRATGVAQFVSRESEPEALAEGFHLGYRNHLASRTAQHHCMRVIDHHAGRGSGEVTRRFSQKHLAIETPESRIALEEQHPRVAQHRRSRLHLAFPAGQFDFVWRSIMLHLLTRIEVVLARRHRRRLSDSARRQNAVNAGYDNSAPVATSSSWTRTRFPLHLSKSSKICWRCDSAFSARCSSGTVVEFERRTFRTATREIPITRAISRLLTPCVYSSRIVVRCAWLNMLVPLRSAATPRPPLCPGRVARAPPCACSRRSPHGGLAAHRPQPPRWASAGRSPPETPTTAAAVPDGARANAPNDGRVGETPVSSDRLNVKAIPPADQYLGIKCAPVSSEAPVGRRAPSRACKHVNSSAARGFAAAV